ncbi:unnamed protein product [Miscanthus lutarioriparius]|uniref:Ribulose bisphosphate carboxylase small subunit n=1 Tax=Miscanthus lutarioriparius TaxID=422564 RepID=A0A811REN3_9POAL|nr:unnamed protein product [Miscanthus lutarioriparius]
MAEGRPHTNSQESSQPRRRQYSTHGSLRDVHMASSATDAAPFQGLKSTAGLPVARRSTNGFGDVSNGERIRCMQYYPLLMLSCNTTMQRHVWPIEGIKRFETLSYLPPLSTEQLLKQIDYLLRSNWVPCLEFSKHNPLKRFQKVVLAT